MSAENHLLTDIKLKLTHHRLRPVYTVAQADRTVPQSKTGVTRFEDMAIVSGKDNFAQAITMRLLTPRGELTALGHPDYGSRLHELIGRENTETTRDLVKLHILESLKRETRLASVEQINVTPHPYYRTRVDVTLVVVPVGFFEPITIGPFTLRLES